MFLLTITSLAEFPWISSLQGVNRRFALTIEDDAPHRIFFPKVEISNYSVTIVGRNFFDEPVNNDRIKYDIVWKITTIAGDDYANKCLLDYFYFKGQHQITAIDLSKQQALDTDLKAVQLITFTGNLDQAGGSMIFFLIEEA